MRESAGRKRQMERRAAAARRPVPRKAKRRVSGKAAELARLWSEFRRTGATAARNRLVENYLPLVRYTAERLKACLPAHIDVYELISAGMVGLIDAVEKFEPERGFRFETFALPRLRGAMFDELRAADWVPRGLRTRHQRLEQADAELAAELHRRPSDEELAERLGLVLTDCVALRTEAAPRVQLRLDGALGDESDPSHLEALADRTSVPPTRPIELRDLHEFAMRVLPEKEAWVLEQYYFAGRSMREIGEELKVTESRVCQVHARALELVRASLRRDENPAFLAERGGETGSEARVRVG